MAEGWRFPARFLQFDLVGEEISHSQDRGTPRSVLFLGTLGVSPSLPKNPLQSRKPLPPTPPATVAAFSPSTSSTERWCRLNLPRACSAELRPWGNAFQVSFWKQGHRRDCPLARPGILQMVPRADPGEAHLEAQERQLRLSPSLVSRALLRKRARRRRLAAGTMAPRAWIPKIFLSATVERLPVQDARRAWQPPKASTAPLDMHNERENNLVRSIAS